MRRVLGLVVTLAITGAPGLNAQGRGKGKHEQNETVERYTEKASITISIGRNDQRIIREWFSQESNTRGLPPGLAKRESLPPGLQKQLVRNGQLPPGLQKKVQPLPPTLEARLTPLPAGTRRVIINGSVILLDQQKNLIVDIFAAF
jgi:hypothetical protein